MDNPQSELYNLLADATLRRSHIQGTYAKHHATVVTRQQQLLSQLEEMRSRIQAGGIGSDPSLEDEYLKTLDDLGRLDNSYEMGKRLLPPEPAPAPMPEHLTKFARLGRILIGVYGGELQKSGEVCSDMERVGRVLVRYPETSELGDRLLKSVQY